MFRRLSRHEIDQLADALRTLEAWEQVRDFALRIYGSRAHTVEVEQVLIYPDPTEIRFSLVMEIDCWSVYDEDGNLLEPDLTLEFWQSCQEVQQQVSNGGTIEQAKLSRIVRAEINRAVPAEEETYQLGLPPVLPFQFVYVNDAEIPAN